MMEIAIKALWFTLIAYGLFIAGRWAYIKYLKPQGDPFFYFLSLNYNEKGECYIRVSSPSNEFELDISIIEDDAIIFTKNAHLKMGINRIFISTIPKSDNGGKIQLKSATQMIERAFVETEN